MHQHEQARLHALHSVIAGEIAIGQAAALLDLSERHVRRLLAAYREHGARALAHGNRGRRPHNALPEAVAATVVRLAARRYGGANHTHRTELLAEQHGIALSRSTVRRILARAGMPSPRRRRPPEHRVRRERMPREGMLLQVDGSHHAWLEQRGPRFALLLAVDDATGSIMHALFRPAEDARGHFLLMEQVVCRRGIPLALDSDRHAVFRASARQREAPPQFARALAELGVRQIFARSPQAKGHVERVAGTFQDRLVTERRFAGATTIGEAQPVLERFLPRFNAHFAVAARQPEPAGRPLDPALDLGAILGFGHVRQVARDHTVQYRWRCCPPRSGPAPPACASRCWERPGGELAVRSQRETIPSRLARARLGGDLGAYLRRIGAPDSLRTTLRGFLEMTIGDAEASGAAYMRTYLAEMILKADRLRVSRRGAGARASRPSEGAMPLDDGRSRVNCCATRAATRLPAARRRLGLFTRVYRRKEAVCAWDPPGMFARWRRPAANSGATSRTSSSRATTRARLRPSGRGGSRRWIAGLGKERPHGGDEVVGNHHHRLRRVAEGGLDLGSQLVLRLRLVVLKDVADTRIIPARREPVLRVAHLLLLRLRRRNALRALPDNS